MAEPTDYVDLEKRLRTYAVLAKANADYDRRTAPAAQRADNRNGFDDQADDLEKAASAISALVREREWQPMETAAARRPIPRA